MLLRSNPVPDDKIVQPNFVYSATGSPEHPTLGLAPVFDLSVLVCSKDQMNSQHRFLVVIICGYALQLRKLSYDFCAKILGFPMSTTLCGRLCLLQLPRWICHLRFEFVGHRCLPLCLKYQTSFQCTWIVDGEDANVKGPEAFCDHSSTGCGRKSAITQSQDVAEILETLIKGWIQQFSNLTKTSQ